MNIIVDAVNSSLMNPDDCGDSKTASVRRWWHLLKAICWDSNEGGYWLARTFPWGGETVMYWMKVRSWQVWAAGLQRVKTTSHSPFTLGVLSCVCVCDPNPLNKMTEDFRTTRLKNCLSVSALKWLFSIIKPVEILQFDVFSCCSDSWRLCASRFLVSFSWKISRSFCFCAGFIFPFALPKSRQKSFKIAGASQIKVKNTQFTSKCQTTWKGINYTWVNSQKHISIPGLTARLKIICLRLLNGCWRSAGGDGAISYFCCAVVILFTLK